MQIEPARPEDEAGIIEITIQAYENVTIEHTTDRRFGVVGPTDWRRRKADSVRAELADPNVTTLLAREGEEIAGYATVHMDDKTRFGRVLNLAVSTNNHRRGIGRKLLEASINLMRERGMRLARIETLHDNVAGQRLYPDVGFEEISRQIIFAMPL